MTPSTRKVRVSVLPSPVPNKSNAKLPRTQLCPLHEDPDMSDTTATSTSLSRYPPQNVTKKLTFDDIVVPYSAAGRRMSLVDALPAVERPDTDAEMLVSRMIQVCLNLFYDCVFCKNICLVVNFNRL